MPSRASSRRAASTPRRLADAVGARASFGTVELRGGHARAVLIPALGGKISELWFGDRQWLWTNPQLPYRAPSKGASYALTADSGGLDECFPTVAACALPSTVRGAGGRELPDHGELWSQPAPLQLTTGEGGHRAHVTWLGEALPSPIGMQLLTVVALAALTVLTDQEPAASPPRSSAT